MIAEFVEVAKDLRFPEGPVALPDGSVVVVEMMGRCITRIMPAGTKQTLAEIAGGPNGLALDPDGAFDLCNNGGSFSETTYDGVTYRGPFDPSLYIGGRIQRVDLNTGVVTDLYTHCDELQLRRRASLSTRPLRHQQTRDCECRAHGVSPTELNTPDAEQSARTIRYSNF